MPHRHLAFLFMTLVFPYILTGITTICCLLYCYQIWKWYFIWQSTPCLSFDHSKNNPSTSFSILVAFRNEAQQLPLLLQSLAAQTASNWELILIDDHSDDASLKIINHYRERIPTRVKLVTNRGIGKKEALQTGAQEASGNYLLMTDADCYVPPEWIRTYQHSTDHFSSGLIIGPVELTGQNSFLHRFQKREFHALQITGAAAAINKHPIMCNGANIACRRDLFLAANLQKAFSSGDDMFLLEWMKQHHKPISFLKHNDAKVTTRSENTWKAFLMQRARWASKARGYQDKDIIQTGLLVASTSSLLFITLITACFLPSLLWIWSVLMLVKGISDFTLLKAGRSLWHNRDNIIEYSLAQVLYPLYLLATISLPVFHPLQWKSRQVK